MGPILEKTQIQPIKIKQIANDLKTKLSVGGKVEKFGEYEEVISL